MLVRKQGGTWEEPPVRAYDNEAALQQLLADAPQLVADLTSMAAVTVREIDIPGMGYLDVLVVRADGELTLVEAKLSSNPEIRRAVVGQLLGYAGGMWQLSYDALDASVHRRTGATLIDIITRVTTEEPFDGEAFRRAVAANLASGTFRLVFAVDAITPDLRRTVEYLNTHTAGGTEVLALEMGYAKVDDLEILQPTLHGVESARVSGLRRGRHRWTEQELFASLDEMLQPDHAAALRQLYDWSSTRASRFSFGDGASPSVTVVFPTPDGEIQPYTIYAESSGAVVGINFEWVRRRPETAVEGFLSDLLVLPTVAQRAAAIRSAGYAKRPSVPAAELVGQGVRTLQTAIERLIDAPART